MEKENFIISHKLIIKQRNFALAGCCFLLLTNFILSVVIISSDQEVILVPNSIDKETSISYGKMSSTYLEALTRDVTNLMLNVTPANSEYNTKAILKITHPAFYGQLKKALNSRSQDIKNRKISTYFSGQSMIVGEDNLSVVVVGKLASFLGKEEVSNEEKYYSISYVYEGFRPLIVGFEEVDAKGNPIKEEVVNEKNNN